MSGIVAVAGLVTLFVWWFSTGAILCAVRHADRGAPAAHGRNVLFGLPLLIAGAAGLGWSLTRGDVAGAYAGFLSSIAVWGWIELAFLSGVVTGPSRLTCPPGTAGWERLKRAWDTVAWHELSLVAALLLIAQASAGAVNTVAFWTFAVLFAARISAKLNIFLGVPRVNVEFLPAPLAHLPSHFRQRRLNWLFPLSVSALSLTAAWWLQRLGAATTPAEAVGFAILATLTALALLEHWLMVLPLPDAKLWRWMIPAPKTLGEKTHGL
jgi:putative photosynthetic complex assembly protein 2